MLIDSHCHLDHEKIEGDPADLVRRAENAGVRHMISIATKLENFDRVKAIAAAHDSVSMAIGVHPHAVGESGIASADQLLAYCDDPDVVGIGETGLDYFYDYGPVDAQKKNFELHIDAAREADLPLIVHTRDAEADTVEIIARAKAKGDFRCLIHCFTGSQWLADACRELDCYFSASGVVTFKKSQDLRDTFASIPLDRIIVETDSPYLAPTPHRGKANEPAYVKHTAAVMADVHQITAEAFEMASGNNFLRLFSKVKIK